MKKVLIIGAGFLQSFVIKKAKELGYYVIAVDGNKNAEGFQFCDEYEVIDIVNKEECLKYAKEKNINGVLTAATDYGVLTASYISKNLDLPGLNYETAQVIKNKYLVRKILFENQVDDTEQAFQVDLNTDYNQLKEEIKYPVMVKPCDGSGSRGATRVDDDEILKEACLHAVNNSITGKAEIETFIIGNEYGVESLVENGKIHILSVMKKWMTKPPYYAELGHAIPCGLDVNLENKVKLIIKKAIECLKINFGSVNMDILITNSGTVHIIDIGARMGGNMIGPYIIPYGTGIDYISNLLKIHVGDIPNWTVGEKKAVVSRLLAFEEGNIKKIPNIKNIEKEYDVEIFHHLRLGRVNKYKTNLDGLGYIISRAVTFETAEKKANHVLEIIKKELF